jgi:iron complex outermembrane receptor protein
MYRNSNDAIYYSVGGLQMSDEKYLLHQRSFELNSLLDYHNEATAYVDRYGSDSTHAAIERYKGILKPNTLNYVHPEKVTTVEIGYQRLLLNNKLHLDMDVFGSIYKDLIAYQWVGQAAHGNPYNADSVTAAAADILDWNVNGFNVPMNLEEEVRTWGIEGGVEYNLGRNYTLSGNFIYQKATKQNELKPFDPEIWLFQVAPLKTNVALSNPKCWRNWGFAVNWHWTDAMDNYWNSFNLIVNNHIHANNILDAQVMVRLPRLNSSFKFGASNLLNHYYQNVAYGASIGGAYYFSVLYGIE